MESHKTLIAKAILSKESNAAGAIIIILYRTTVTETA
jgi:hypothetical protein